MDHLSSHHFISKNVMSTQGMTHIFCSCRNAQTSQLLCLVRTLRWVNGVHVVQIFSNSFSQLKTALFCIFGAKSLLRRNPIISMIHICITGGQRINVIVSVCPNYVVVILYILRPQCASVSPAILVRISPDMKSPDKSDSNLHPQLDYPL